MTALGVDHVQFSVPSLPRAVELLVARGWELQFEEPGFARGARPYFRGVDKSMAYLKRGRAAIELVDASESAGPEAWLPLFGSRLPGEAVERGVRAPDGTTAVRVEELGGTCLCRDERADALELEGLLLRTGDPAASQALLETVGFRPSDEGRLLFPGSFLCMELAVTLVAEPREAREDAYVDDLGPSLVALISKHLDADRSRLREAGFEPTEVFDYVIHGRPIRNAIVRGAGGEWIELIELGRAST